MMDDEPWIIEDPNDAPPEEAPPAEEGAAAEAAPAEPEEPAEPEAPVKDPNRKLIFKHWVRPKFLQYKYMYDYRHNYYDDVIDFLDRRNRGIAGREPPRAQTWAERALRTYCANSSRQYNTQSDKHLLAHISTGARFHRYHSKSLISRKYSSLGFTSIII